MIDLNNNIYCNHTYLEEIMRDELMPKLEFSEKTLNKLIKMVSKATSFLRQNNRKYAFLEKDEREKLIKKIKERLEYKEFREIEEKIFEIIGKDMNQYHKSDFWIFRSKKIAFILSVSEPKVINDFTKDQLTIIVTNILKGRFFELKDKKFPIAKVYGEHLIEYYIKLLDINFKINSL